MNSTCSRRPGVIHEMIDVRAGDDDVKHLELMMYDGVKNDLFLCHISCHALIHVMSIQFNHYFILLIK